jgi:ketosteroid isomerase-like protein
MLGKTQIAATDIAEALLDLTGTAIMKRDFDAFAPSFQLPHVMVTIKDVITVETSDDLRRAFDQMCDHFAAIGVTDLVRQIVAAEYKTPARIQSTHVADLLHNGKRLADPYPVYSVLEKIDGQWKITSSEYAVEPMSGPALALACGDASKRKPSKDGNI